MKLFKRKSMALDKNNSQWADIWFRLRRNKPAMLGLAVLFLIALLAISADLLADYDTMAIAHNPQDRLQGPSLEHLLGTDAYGRDMFARVIHGARYSLTFALVCTFFGVTGGVLVGWCWLAVRFSIQPVLFGAVAVLLPFTSRPHSAPNRPS